VAKKFDYVLHQRWDRKHLEYYILLLNIIFLSRKYAVIWLSGGGLKICNVEGLKKCNGRVIGFSSTVGDTDSYRIEDTLICCTGSSRSRCRVLSEVCVERKESYTIVVLSFSISPCLPLFQILKINN
jgi:hypothetical protein